MVALLKIAAAAVSLFAAATLAHPGEVHNADKAKREMDLHRRVAIDGANALERCSDSVEARKANEADTLNRYAHLQNIRRSLGLEIDSKIEGRNLDDLKKWETFASVRNMNNKGRDTSTPLSTFGDSKPSCILTPETIVGPFFYQDELIRNSIADGQPGVRMVFILRLISTKNCQPLEGFWVDVWGTNATGVYSSAPAGSPIWQGGMDTNFQRGAQQTDKNGIVWFDGIFPGHYNGRATHVHVMARSDVNTNNGRVSGYEWDSNVRHIGQVYFDESLRAEVEATDPYTSNKQQSLTNEQDIYAQAQASPEYDPYVNWVYINGKDVKHGIIAWISIGIDSDASHPQGSKAARPWKE